MKRKILVLMMAGLISLSAVACSGNPDTQETDSKTEDIATDVADESEPEEPSYTQYEAGMYKVGTDIPAGTYLVTGDSGYIEVSSDSSGQLDAIIANDNYVNRTYMSVSDGQYFKFDGVAIPEAEAPAYVSENGAYQEGKYLVGKDIPAGEYKISLTDDNITGYGYIEVSSDASGTLNAIVTNSNIQGDTYQTIQDGQYLRLNGAEIKGQ